FSRVSRRLVVPLERNGHSCSDLRQAGSKAALKFVCRPFSVFRTVFELLKKHEPCQRPSRLRERELLPVRMCDVRFVIKLQDASSGERTGTNFSRVFAEPPTRRLSRSQERLIRLKTAIPTSSTPHTRQ